MTIYTPANDGQITQKAPIPFDPEGRNSCVAYAGAYAVGDATNGRVHPTGNNVRDWTKDHAGGLELDQVDYAITAHTDLNPITDVYTAGEFYGHLASGYGAVLIGAYEPVVPTRFDAFSNGFYGNHAWYVPPGLKVMDPGADGRRADVYSYHGEAYPKWLIDAFAAALVIGTAPHQRHAGPDHFEATMFRLESAPAALPWRLEFSGPGDYWDYDAHVATRTISDRTRRHSGGFSGTCTAPARYVWPGVGAYTLVRMLSGSHGDAALGKGRGHWIARRAAHVTVKEV